MRHLLIVLVCLLATLNSSCGKAGKDGEDGVAGVNGADNTLAKLMACEISLTSYDGYWDGTSLSYQRADTTYGDVTVSVLMKGVRKGYALSFYKKGMEGAILGGITVATDGGVFLEVAGYVNNNGPHISVLATGASLPKEEYTCSVY